MLLLTWVKLEIWLQMDSGVSSLDLAFSFWVGLALPELKVPAVD